MVTATEEEQGGGGSNSPVAGVDSVHQWMPAAFFAGQI